jgi:hypothetical protein
MPWLNTKTKSIKPLAKRSSLKRLEKKKASRIKYEISVKDFDGRFSDENRWNDLIEWYRKAMVRFYEAVQPVWEKVQKETS